jgi:hypothetical protein
MLCCPLHKLARVTTSRTHFHRFISTSLCCMKTSFEARHCSSDQLIHRLLFNERCFDAPYWVSLGAMLRGGGRCQGSTGLRVLTPAESELIEVGM